MTTPYEQAKELGYTDEQINEYFSKKDPEFSKKYEKATELGYKPEEIYSKAYSSFAKNNIEEEKKLSNFERLKQKIGESSERFKQGQNNFGKTLLKGTLEGVSRLGKAMGPTYEKPKIKDGKIILGRDSKQELESQTENLNELLPNNEGFFEKSVRRGLQNAPTALAFPGSKLENIPRVLSAGIAGQSAKELELPEWAETAAELTTFIGPDLTKKLLSSGKNKEIIEFAKKMGMTDEQITPLIQSNFKQKWLSKLAPKRGSTSEALENTKEGLNKVYGTIQNSSKAGKEILEKDNGKLINGLYQKLDEMPRTVRSLIDKDLGDLLDNKITGKSLINFWRDINSKYGSDKKILSTLKEPVKEALASISPDLAKDFEMVNKLYTKFYPIAKKLKPNLMTDIIGASEYIGGAGSVLSAIMGNYQPLLGMVGERAARKIAQQMLINPNLQQISEKMVLAINQNKPMVVRKLANSYAQIIGKYSPEYAEEIKNMGENQYKEFISENLQ